MPNAFSKGYAPRRTTVLSVVGASIIVLLVAGPFLYVSGQRLVGYRYGVWVDNSLTVCPSVVVARSGMMLSLADGRTVQIERGSADELADDLARAQNFIYIHPITHLVYGRFRLDHCGFDDPRRSQFLTIPLIREDIHSHGRQVIGRAIAGA